MANKKRSRQKTIPIRPGREDPGSNRLFLRRTFRIMAVCGIVLFIPVLINLFHMMITKHEMYESRAIANQTRSTSITASRGTIYDRNMNTMAVSATVENVFLDPVNLRDDEIDLEELAEDLAEILDVDEDFILESARDVSTQYKVIARKISEDLAD